MLDWNQIKISSWSKNESIKYFLTLWYSWVHLDSLLLSDFHLKWWKFAFNWTEYTPVVYLPGMIF